ncbi:MAG: hypothetical protein QOI95_448 [Acidimicrobiaceae bacterium]
MRWTDGSLSAEPLVETLVAAFIRERRIVRAEPGAPGWPAQLEEAEPAALTILEALYEVGAHIVRWDGHPQGIAGDGSGNEQPR